MFQKNQVNEHIYHIKLKSYEDVCCLIYVIGNRVTCAGVCTYIRSLVGGDVKVLIIYDTSRTEVQGYFLKENLE